mmetsp:Transcript_2341/g.2833  ORF Transcript_2341/g.2833 Transcript_2341/m.2833 type:complete len:93 (+) Transcript_2341:264-542(+)|eukprot:CAMPEP_0203637868 /NCGR_PEP_ID=MMETSP0088-20131115/4071_1 /ASSEMBLY_ACC=CAM_ASM_001087 /TAXON_ID=426623 /ORGANISM="Chaetoceros affinis, Strain CCMP159" /LENGTH=92 /DNA_ID=CAMNT_0050492403 /DNA_START=151 /DNA_END=432 /DNA_ORIENTATION=+
MPRTDGRKIVALAFGATTLAVGIGQIYLPYIADRDKLRGLFEEEDMPQQARMEMEMMMRQEQQQQQSASGLESQKEKGKNSAGSMWQNLRRN